MPVGDVHHAVFVPEAGGSVLNENVPMSVPEQRPAGCILTHPGGDSLWSAGGQWWKEMFLGSLGGRRGGKKK